MENQRKQFRQPQIWRLYEYLIGIGYGGDYYCVVLASDPDEPNKIYFSKFKRFQRSFV